MLYYSFYSYIAFAASALIYGLIFSFVILSISTVAFIISQIFRGVFLSVFYNGRLTDVLIPKSKEKKSKENKFLSNLACALKIIIFTLGFILVSYSAFDGEIRLFALVISILSFFVFSRYVFPIPERIIFLIFSKIIAYFCILIRIILYPLRRIVLCFVKKARIYLHFDNICKLNSIDNINKKC